LQMPLHWISQTVFTSYFIPGLVLFLANGVSSLLLFIVTFLRISRYSLGIVLQGCVLTGWIIIQVLLLNTVHMLHWVLTGMGLLLMLSGLVLNKATRSKTSAKL
jgi:hypothetical protein